MFLRKPKHSALPEVAAGADVVTADGASLGSIKEVHEAAFKVDAPLAPDYWLGREYVVQSAPERVWMSFIESDLNAYKLNQPRIEMQAGVSDDPVQDYALPEDQQFAQRIQMERELAQQRRELAHDHPGGEDAPPDTGGTIGIPVEEELRELGVDPPAGEMEHEGVSPTGAVVRDSAVDEEREQVTSERIGPAVTGRGEQEVPDPYIGADEEHEATRARGGYGQRETERDFERTLDDFRGPDASRETSFDYSVPTAEQSTPNPAGMRGMPYVAIAAWTLAIAGGALWLLRRRRRAKRIDERVIEAVRERAPEITIPSR